MMRGTEILSILSTYFYITAKLFYKTGKIKKPFCGLKYMILSESWLPF